MIYSKHFNGYIDGHMVSRNGQLVTGHMVKKKNTLSVLKIHGFKKTPSSLDTWLLEITMSNGHQSIRNIPSDPWLLEIL